MHFAIDHMNTVWERQIHTDFEQLSVWESAVLVLYSCDEL